MLPPPIKVLFHISYLCFSPGSIIWYFDISGSSSRMARKLYSSYCLCISFIDSSNSLECSANLYIWLTYLSMKPKKSMKIPKKTTKHHFNFEFYSRNSIASFLVSSSLYTVLSVDYSVFYTSDSIVCSSTGACYLFIFI